MYSSSRVAPEKQQVHQQRDSLTAETLGVSHSTFLPHVRKAEQKIFRQAFDSKGALRDGEGTMHSS